MDIEKLIERLKSKDFERDYDCTPFECGVFGLLDDAATALSTLQVKNEKLRVELEKRLRERDEAIKICAKLMALCSPPKEWVPKLFRRHINRPGDYMGCGYTFLDSFNLIIENFVETADDELYTAIRNATEKEIIERSNRNKEE